MVIKLEHDFLDWSESRALARAFRGLAAVSAGHEESRVVRHVFFLWRELALAAQVHGRPGLVEISQLQLCPQLEEDFSLLEGKDWNPRFLAPDPDGREGVVYCARFAALHKDLDPRHRTMQQRGAAVTKHRNGLNRFARSATQLSLLIPAERFRKPDGGVMSADEVRRVMALIRAYDQALGNWERPENGEGYSETLIRGACGLLQRYNEAQLLAIAEALMEVSDHPAIPNTTERLFERFDEVARLDVLRGEIVRAEGRLSRSTRNS